MNWAQFKDPVSHICLAGAVVASWSLTLEITGSNPFSGKYFFTEFREYIENIQRKLQYFYFLIAATDV